MCKDIFDNIVITGGQDILGTISNWKLDTGGTILKIKNVSFSNYHSLASSCIKPTNDTGFIIVGDAALKDSFTNLRPDCLIIKTDSAFNSPVITKIIRATTPIANEFKIYQNYPNPFNPITNIKYQIQKAGLVTLKIYDITGREIKILVNEVKYPGSYTVTFNAREFSSGVYFYRIQSGDFVQVKKMILLK